LREFTAREATMVASAREFFETLEAQVEPDQTAGVKNSYLFDIEGVGSWKVDVNDGEIKVTEGTGDADVTISISEENFLKINRGELLAPAAFMGGQMKVKGDVGAAMLLEKFL
jgi:putative sterol carrier protein